MKDIVLPFDRDQRYFFFRNILWNYGQFFLSKEDYKKIGKPKKVAAVFGGAWLASFYGLKYIT